MNESAKNPSVSVIMASYNHEAFVREALESVLIQEIPGMEIIVIDDGSSDSTPEEIKSLKDSRINFVGLKENRRFHPRNMALSMARGKYIAFQNSDDVWKKGKLAKQLEKMENDEKLSVCFTAVEPINESGETMYWSWLRGIFSTENMGSGRWLRRFFDRGNCLCISSAVVRRDLLQRAGNFCPSLINLGDFDLWVRLAALGGFHIIDEKLTRMRICGNKNLSAPTPDNVRRTKNEKLQVLHRYLEAPVFERVGEIFSDIIPPGNKSDISVLGNLAFYAWRLSPIHAGFGNMIIEKILVDEKKREAMVETFGTKIIKEYIQQKGKLELIRQS